MQELCEINQNAWMTSTKLVLSAPQIMNIPQVVLFLLGSSTRVKIAVMGTILEVAFCTLRFYKKTN